MSCIQTSTAAAAAFTRVRVSPGRQLKHSAQNSATTRSTPSGEPHSPARGSDRAGAKQPGSAVKPEYLPSDNSSSSSASLARTSAGSDAGSRSAIPPLEKTLKSLFPGCFSTFSLSSPFLKSPKIQSRSNCPCVSHRVRQQRCGTAAKQLPSWHKHGGSTSGI